MGRRRRRVAEHHVLCESRQRGRVRRDGSPVAQQRDRCHARRGHEHHGHDHGRRRRWRRCILRHHVQRIRGRRVHADGDGLGRAQRAGRRSRERAVPRGRRHGRQKRLQRWRRNARLGSGETGVRSFTVSITDDAAIESTETVALSLSNAVGAVLGAPAAATLSISDDDDGGSIAFSSATYSGSEVDGSAPTVTISVVRSRRRRRRDRGVPLGRRHGRQRRLRRRRRSIGLGSRQTGVRSSRLHHRLTRPSRAPRRSRCRCRIRPAQRWARRRRRRCRSPTTTPAGPSRSRRDVQRFRGRRSTPNGDDHRQPTGSDGPASVQYNSTTGTATDADFVGGDGTLSWAPGRDRTAHVHHHDQRRQRCRTRRARALSLSKQ